MLGASPLPSVANPRNTHRGASSFPSYPNRAACHLNPRSLPSQILRSEILHPYANQATQPSRGPHARTLQPQAPRFTLVPDMQTPGPTDTPADPNTTTNGTDFPADLHCPHCAYCLQGLTGDTCPECGQSVASLRSTVSRIPWQSRREIGRFRAYWRTVWMVTFKNKLFCEEYARPVSYPDARRFQFVTILHVFLSVLLATALSYGPIEPQRPGSVIDVVMTGQWPSSPTLADRAYAEVWPVAGLLFCFLLFLAAVTGVPSYFFHPRTISIRQQNSAIAMSYYTCGPVALAAIFVIASAVMIDPSSLRSPTDSPIPLLLILLAALPLFLWWLNLVRLARRIMPQIKGRAALVGIATPLLWLALAGLLLVLLPLALLWIMVVIYSLA